MDAITFLLFLLPFHLHLFKPADSKCRESFTCGNYTLKFPFTQANDTGCGLITVDGCDYDPPHPVIHFGGGNLGYAILDSNSNLAYNSSGKMFIRDLQFEAQLQNRSCFSFMNQSMLRSPSISISFSPNLTLFSCFTPTNESRFDEDFVNYSKIQCLSTMYYKVPTSNDSHSEQIEAPKECSLVQLPLNRNGNSDDLFSMISSNFTIEWNVSEECLSCFNRGGQCLTDNDNQFYCKRGIGCSCL